MATTRALQTVLGGLTFPEGPRWHDGRFWFSDFYTHRVIALSEEGWAETMAHVPQQPSGLGWRPDGTKTPLQVLGWSVLYLMFAMMANRLLGEGIYVIGFSFPVVP